MHEKKKGLLFNLLGHKSILIETFSFKFNNNNKNNTNKTIYVIYLLHVKNKN